MLVILRGLLLASLLILNMNHCAVYNKLEIIEEKFLNRLQQIHGEVGLLKQYQYQNQLNH